MGHKGGVDLLKRMGFTVEKGRVQLSSAVTAEIKNINKTLMGTTAEVDTTADLHQMFTWAIGSVVVNDITKAVR